MGYLSVDGINAVLRWIHYAYPGFTELITLPELSPEGRPTLALKIAKGGGQRSGIALLGGVHAREVVNPDLLVSFAEDLCAAYQEGVSVIYGGHTYPPGDYKLIVELLDVWIVPLVNPDGRAYVQAPNGDAMWRKNRRPTGTCVGVDLNRNFEFLWSSGIGTSSDPCDYQIYRGPNAFSEAEARNVRALLDAYPNIAYLIDVHSYSQDILYPWGDDDDQTTTPNENFRNAAYDGLRGIPGDTVYKEFIDASDLDWYVRTGNAIVDAIKAVRGTTYVSKPSVGLYPTSGTSQDYSYSRTFADGTKRKVKSYTIETGMEFQPPYSEAVNIISEVSSGLTQFCLSCVCPVTAVDALFGLQLNLDAIRAFRDKELLRTTLGRHWAGVFERYGADLVTLVASDESLRQKVLPLMREAATVVLHSDGPRQRAIGARTIERARDVLRECAKAARPELRTALEELSADLHQLSGKALREGIAAAEQARAPQKA
jgi:murein tripeptide amidase MpaA